MGGVGCDNMTVVLACFLHGKSYGDLAKRCSQTLVPLQITPSHMKFQYSDKTSQYSEATPTGTESLTANTCEEVEEAKSITCTS